MVFKTIQVSEPPVGVKIKNDEAICTNLRVWTVVVEGASTTLYEGEKFTLQFRFDEQYPFSSPEVSKLILRSLIIFN